MLLNGDDVHEAIFPAGEVLQRLGIEAGFLTRQRFGMALLLAEPEVVAEASLFVLYTARGEFTQEQQHALAELVAGGRGLVAIHSSAVFGSIGTELDPDFREAFELIGQRYRSHGPEPRWSTVRVELDPVHPVTAGIPSFELFAEHYELEAADDRSDVIAWRAPRPAPSRSSRSASTVVDGWSTCSSGTMCARSGIRRSPRSCGGRWPGRLAWTDASPQALGALRALQVGVVPVEREQLGVAADLDDAAAVEHHDAVRASGSSRAGARRRASCARP